MRILIIGSTSTIGMKLRTSCARLGEIHTAGRKNADISLDLAKCSADHALPGEYDVLIHTAADFGGNQPEDLFRAEQVNTLGSLSVCSMALKAKVKHLIYFSTVSAAYTPQDPFFGSYSLSKRHAEESVELFCRMHQVPLTILRPTQVYDDEGNCRRHQPFLYLIADLAQAGKDVSIWGSRDPVRNFIHLDDLAEIVVRIIEQKMLGHFTCAFPRDVRISEVAAAAFSTFGKGGKVCFLRDKPAQPDLFSARELRWYDALGLSPKIGIQEGFDRIRSFRESTR